jgi:glycosyltransferase involved in cell wall biosynthesis
MKKKELLVLEIVKYYYPSKGGMESFVKLLVDNLISFNSNYFVNVFTVSNQSTSKNIIKLFNRSKITYNRCLLFFRSQPLKFYFSGLKVNLENADIIHHNFPFPNIEIWLLYYNKILSRKKFIITWHANIDNTRWKLFNLLYKPIINNLLNYADYIVVTSPALFENSSILKKHSNKVKVIPLSYDIISFTYNHKTLNPDCTKKILFVGKLREYKGVQFLIESIVDLDVILFIVGDGEYLNVLKKIVNKYNIREKVNFITNANNELLDKFYLNSDLFVLPSINEAEAFGIVQLEALARGLPVINTNLKSGVPYVSLDGLTGFTVQPKDSEALKSSIIRIFSNKDQYENFSKNAIARASIFSSKKMTESYNNLFSNEI